MDLKNKGYIVSKRSQIFHQLKSRTTMGKNTDNDIYVPDSYVNPYHCIIEKMGENYIIKDLNSDHGLRINGVKIREAELTTNDQIQLGSLDFVFKLSSDEKFEDIGDCAEETLKSKNSLWSLRLKSLKNLSVLDLPVFLTGESGTGKEVLAKAIHDLSDRRNEPFVSVNCSSLTETLVESELFGHIKGSFTGATNDRKGAFESARGGTLFLDEIGDLPQSLQPKLLRALENKEIRAVGSDRTVSTDVRIITATHKNLEEAVADAFFRSDLYFRINVIKLSIPPLRERLEDFEDLLMTFAEELKVRFSPEAITRLRRYPWPGNIRELKNVICRASALFPNTYLLEEHVDHIIDQPYLAQLTGSQKGRIHKMPVLKDIEKELIRSRLFANKGNQRKTAMELGMAKSTLHDRIKQYGLAQSFPNLNGFKKDVPSSSVV